MTTHERLPAPADTPTDKPWETMFKAECKKSRVLGATTVAASLLAVGLGAWGLNNDSSAAASGPGQFGGPGTTSQFGPPGTGSMPGQGGPLDQDLGALLLKDDGSVDTEAVQQFVAQMPSGALEQILSFAVQNGELTQAQADQILDASDSASTQDT